MINTFYYPREKEWLIRWRSTIFKKWDSQVTFFASYKVAIYVHNSLYTFVNHVLCHSCYELIKPAMSVYIVCEQLKRHQPLVHTLALSEDFPVCVVHALLHTHAFLKFKSTCTVII